MGSFIFQKLVNEQGLVNAIELRGALVLEHAQKLKEELVPLVGGFDKHLDVRISELEEIDISCIQLIAGFIRVLDRLKVKYSFNWEIDEEQKQLLESIGLSNDFF